MNWNKCEDNWEKPIRIGDAMTGMHTKTCTDLLFGELKRVKSSNQQGLPETVRGQSQPGGEALDHHGLGAVRTDLGQSPLPMPAQ